MCVTLIARDESRRLMRILKRFRCIRVLKNPAFLLACITTLLASGTANAIMVDLLQPNSSGSINTFYGTAIFTSDTTQPTGTGIFEPFLSIQNSGIEQGYNSANANAPFDVKRIPQWNHEFTVGEMKANASVTIGNTPYYRFLLDVNEPNSSNKSRISLDSLKMFTTSTAGQTTTTVESLGVKRFDMDLNSSGSFADSWVMYDDLNHGSGQADIAFLVPASAFAGVPNSQYVYMYQKFGEHEAADNLPSGTEGGFEETRFGGSFSVPPPTPVPEPSTAIPLVGMIMMVVGMERRVRRVVRMG
jgi:hypothetical protein